MPDSKINQKFGNRVRVRVCGICWKAGKLLMINHRGITKGDFWAPPGGGVDFGTDAMRTLKKEFLEETGTHVQPGRFLFACELIRHPLHAIELFFDTRYMSGVEHVGIDPELRPGEQIIREVRFMEVEEILTKPAAERHGIFDILTNREMFENSGGFYRI